MRLFKPRVKTDEEYFSELYRQYRHRMYRLALGLTSSPELAEETVQEAGVKIMQRLDRLRGFPPDELDKWLYVLVKNIALNLLRREKKYILTDEMPDEPIYDNVESQSSYNTLKSLIRSMPEGTRELLEMKYILEYSNKEMAEFLGIGDDALKNRIYRAKRKLIEVLKKEGYDYEG